MKEQTRSVLKKIAINMAVLIVAGIVFFVLLNMFLKSYTHHGESLTVPDFRGMTQAEVERKMQDKELKFEVRDSIYAPNQPRFAVVEQNPKPGSKVKRGRRIYFTINASEAPSVALPDIYNASLRQAERFLKSAGLEPGKLEYRPDLSTTVLEMSQNGKKLQPNDMVKKGTTIDLVIGDGNKTVKVEVPKLTGLTFEEGMTYLRGSNLNLGNLDIAPGVTDQNNAIIYKQNPLPGSGRKLSQGEAVDIFIMDQERYNATLGN